MVTWTIGEAPLRYYLSTGSIQASPPKGSAGGWARSTSSPTVRRRRQRPAMLGPGFREAGYERVGRLYVRRFATPVPELMPLRLRTVRQAQLGFRSNGVLLDGIGPG